MNFIKKQEKIKDLLKERNAVLLVHFYQRDEIQDIADILGDSLALSIEAAKTDAEVIVFAGVHFMAESASILSPEKTVLLPRQEAGCPLADKITVEQLLAEKKKYPQAKVVSYVNSSAAIKAHSDICCTSANAVKVVNALMKDTDEVLMVPDGNLARYTARFTEKTIIPWNGYCPVHHFLSCDDVRIVQNKYPAAKFAAHPECTSEVLDMADFVGSTGGILKFAEETDAKEIIIGTEKGILYQLHKRCPDKTFIPASDSLICDDMKSITLDDILTSLTEMKYIVKVSEEIRIPANRALSRMLELS